MNIEPELKKLAGAYEGAGYKVVFRPGPEDLPPFAKDFKVELVMSRGDEGVFVSVKKNRLEMEADKDMPRYAEIISAHPGWRYDFVILEAEPPHARELRGAEELSGEDVLQTLGEAEEMARMRFIRAAVVTAWSGLEAAMRMKLRSSGEKAGWSTTPRELLNELYSSGVLLGEEFSRLERLYAVRSQIVHGFASPTSDAEMVTFMAGLTRRLVDESRPVKQTA
ncbi:MAG TPA: hypothetical protein VMG10_11460 [Gemmataceae bacterium]|nr:hypothetical protein [Gemmataceae bacterium]